MSKEFISQSDHDELGRFVKGRSFPPEVRFWTYVKKTDTCWNWIGGTTGRGYGHFYDGTKEMLAHRFSYILSHGSIPDGLYICHTCDHPLCVNPNHLFAGTQKDNLKDASMKGRQLRPNPATGENNGNSKLTKENVKKIKSLLNQTGFTLTEIGDTFGVGHSTISAIKKGIIWGYVTI